MKTKPNIYATPMPWDTVARGYERAIMRVLAQYAAEAVALARLPRGAAVLDVACGPGTLSLIAAKKAARVDAVDFSRRMTAICRRRLKEAGAEHVKVRRGDGQALPFADASFDAAFSMFGLMFFPDRMKGFAELFRTLKPGGRAVVSSWAPVSRSPAMKTMFGALRAMDPSMPEPTRTIRTLEDPKVFKEEMSGAGFTGVRIVPVRKPFPAASVRAFWTAMTEGSAPIVLMRRKWGERSWKAREPLALAHLRREWPKIAGRLTSDAWLGIGTKPKGRV